MKDVTNAKGLSELRTATTHHIASKPPRKGTDFLDLYALSMERQRLETELERLQKRQKRINERVTEIHRAMERLLQATERQKETECTATLDDRQAVSRPANGGTQWKRISVEY